MKNFLFILAVLMMITSCGLLRKKEVIRNEVYRDSISIRNEVFVDTLRLPIDSFNGKVNLELLKKIGELTFRGDRTTTKLYYKDGDIGFTTMSDSIFKLILSRISEIEIKQSTSVDATSNTTAEKPKSTPVLNRIIALAVIILLIAIISYLIILKFKK